MTQSPDHQIATQEGGLRGRARDQKQVPQYPQEYKLIALAINPGVIFFLNNEGIHLVLKFIPLFNFLLKNFLMFNSVLFKIIFRGPGVIV